jgi:hypothetical protein
MHQVNHSRLCSSLVNKCIGLNRSLSLFFWVAFQQYELYTQLCSCTRTTQAIRTHLLEVGQEVVRRDLTPPVEHAQLPHQGLRVKRELQAGQGCVW